MEFKRCFARRGSLFAFFVVLSFAWSLKVAAQQVSPSSNSNNNAPALAPAKPVSQAAVRCGPADDSAKPSASAASSIAVSANQTTPSMRLGAGDLIEVSVYNVPELSTKARISNTGDVYL
ncbi:MAG: polysaccharide biosynthesis/export family protein, partial [Candidatus Sulfotelmatobacter sp.]